MSGRAERTAAPARAPRPVAAPVTVAGLPGGPVGELSGLIGNQAVHRLLSASRGEPLDAGTRAFMEARVGADLGAVRVHTGAAAAESARGLGALAYSVGPHVVFAAGRYDPSSPAGAGLLGHELAHVARGRGRVPAVRRKPDPTALAVVVPDPVEVTADRPFQPGVEYAWQNPVIRARVFPARNSAFRQFLTEERERELRAELAGPGFTPDLASQAGGEILAERRRLTDELAEHARARKAAEAALRAAQAGTRGHRADPEVRQQERSRRELAAKQAALTGRAKAQRARIAQLEGLGPGIGAGAQRELDQRRAWLADLDADLAAGATPLAEVTGKLEAGLAPFTASEAALTSEIGGHRKAEATLGPQLRLVAGGVDAKTGRAGLEPTIRWRLAQFRQQLAGLEHDDLLSRVLDRLDADRDFSRFSKLERYLVLHFSGMRYASAKRTWGPPQELLATLKQQEVRELFAEADSQVVEKLADETGAQVEEELADARTVGRRAAQLRGVKRALAGPADARARLFAREPAKDQDFDALEAATADRAAALAGQDAAGVEQAQQRIEELAKRFKGPELKRIRSVLADAGQRRLRALRDFRVDEAQRAMSGLSDLAALSVLQALRPQFPDWVWHEVVRRTQLRVNVTDPGWDDPPPAGLDPKAPETIRWRAILAKWPREGGVSIDKQAEQLEIVATAVVCNQLAEQAAAVRGTYIQQGIGGAVRWYQGAAAKAAAAPTTGSTSGGPTAYFKRPTGLADFVPGAGLFWAHFESDWGKANANQAHFLAGIDYLTEGLQVIRDQVTENGWTIHVDPKSGDITRTRKADKAGDPDRVEWFAWQHEATVLRAGGKWITTFETSAGARRTGWPLDSLTNPMSFTYFKNQHADTNAFVGFAPGRDSLPQLDRALKNIVPSAGGRPGRDAL